MKQPEVCLPRQLYDKATVAWFSRVSNRVANHHYQRHPSNTHPRHLLARSQYGASAHNIRGSDGVTHGNLTPPRLCTHRRTDLVFSGFTLVVAQACIVCARTN